MTNFYPASPVLADPCLTQPPLSFRQQILKVMGCILLFFVTYLALLLCAVALAAGCITAGVALILRMPGAFPVVIGGGMIMLGVMLLVFLFKFLFSRQKNTRACRTLLQESEHPRLFEFIKRLAAETQNRFPEKIFAVPDVNASVSYRSSLLSLFWSTGKQLEIGLGLVNSVNLSEFKMVLAHEFGHFSQRSMKLGSYVYLLNRVIYNILYENEGWNNTIVKWAGINVVFNLFARLTIWLATGIQYVLRQLYGLINREYMSLSREMEFHADAVALSIAGSEAALSGMRRIEMSGFCFEHCLQKLVQLGERKQRFRNLFPAHTALLQYYARQNRLLLDSAGLPVITEAYLQTFSNSRVQFRDQWASHPTREEREARFRAANIPGEMALDSAWKLFNEPERLQEAVTAQVYELEAPGGRPFQWHTPEAVITELEQRRGIYEFPAVFNEYYNNRPFIALTAGCLQPLPPAELAALSLGTLYAAANVARIRHFFRDQHDLETLQAIAGGQIQARFFEFDGQKYHRDQAGRLASRLEAAVKQEQEWLVMHNRLAFRFHYTRALQHHPEQAQALLQLYENVLQHQEKAQVLGEQVVRIMHCLGLLFGTAGITMEEALPHFDTLQQESNRFRQRLQELWRQPVLTAAWDNELREKAAHFLQHPYTYLQQDSPRITEIQRLQEISSAVLEHYNDSITLLKKEYLLAAETAG